MRLNQIYLDNSVSLRFLDRILRGSRVAAFARRIPAVASQIVAGSRLLGFLRVGDYLHHERESLWRLESGSLVLQELNITGQKLRIFFERIGSTAVGNLNHSKAVLFGQVLRESSSGHRAMAFFFLFLGAYLFMRVIFLALIPPADRVTPFSGVIIIAGISAVLLARINTQGIGKGALERVFSCFRRLLDITRSVSRHGFTKLKSALCRDRIPPVEGGRDR